jgi:hypothetical protein
MGRPTLELILRNQLCHPVTKVRKHFLLRWFLCNDRSQSGSHIVAAKRMLSIGRSVFALVLLGSTFF